MLQFYDGIARITPRTLQRSSEYTSLVLGRWIKQRVELTGLLCFQSPIQRRSLETPVPTANAGMSLIYFLCSRKCH